MVPDIERQWIAEEQLEQAPKPGRFVALLVVLVLFVYWRCCG